MASQVLDFSEPSKKSVDINALANALPKLPGIQYHDLTKTNFAKGSVFKSENGLKLVDDDKAGIGGRNNPAAERKPVVQQWLKNAQARLNIDVSQNEDVPSWVEFDKQVLRFFAYYTDGMIERREETYRVQKVEICYFLEDDTTEVTESRLENSGLPHGVLVKRHRVPKVSNGGMEGELLFNVEDFHIGETVTLYNKTFLIYDCDKFTRNFLTKIGLEVGQPVELPEDPYTTNRVKLEVPKTSSAKQRPDALEKFLENDGKVLRFYMMWDDRESLYGDLRKFVLHYFLADDTVEVNEVFKPNCGRDPSTLLVKRMKMPKFERPNGTVVFYEPGDFVIGRTINVFSRHMVIVDADPFTKRYYEEVYGLEDMEPLVLAEPEDPLPRVPIPPPTQFGTDEDSLGQLFSISTPTPKQDFKKIMGNAGKIMRFSAHLETTRKEDIPRRFTVAFYLADDTVSVFEPSRRNSGFVGGKFFQRAKIRDPENFLGKYYSEEDFYVGRKLKLNSYIFVLDAADEWTLAHMEGRPHIHKYADLKLVHRHIREQVKVGDYDMYRVFIKMDKDNDGYVEVDEFDQVMLELGVDLTPQQTVTLFRHYDVNGDGLLQFQEFVGAIGSQEFPDTARGGDEALHKIDPNDLDHIRLSTRVSVPENRLPAVHKALQLITKAAFAETDDLHEAVMIITGNSNRIPAPELKVLFQEYGVRLEDKEWVMLMDHFTHGKDQIYYNFLCDTFTKLRRDFDE